MAKKRREKITKDNLNKESNLNLIQDSLPDKDIENLGCSEKIQEPKDFEIIDLQKLIENDQNQTVENDDFKEEYFLM